jgi:DNA-binding CsgD family transcriptional regulator
LIKINIDTKKYYTAYRQLDTVQLLIKNTPEDVLGLLANYSDLKSQLDEQTGHLKQSLAGRKLYEFYKDSILKRDNNTAVERVKLRYEIDQRINQQNRFESNEKIHRLELSAGIAMLILLMVISMLVYNRQRLKSKKDKELLIAEKEVVDERLKNAGIALHRFTENLRQKNALIENFKNEVDRLDKQSVIRKNAGNLESLLQAHIMTDDNWNDFKKLFSKVYPGFFVTLSKYHPHLSSTDTRILALIKLGLKNTEMANMLGITVEGIKKAKQRLRKKIDIQTINEIENSTFEG